MLDALSLDQLRTFVAAADEGSFSAAGRKLGRTQSVVSQAIANMEGLLGVKLFNRTGRYPELAPGGTALLASARQVVRDVDAIKARARSLANGLETQLHLVIDVMFPLDVLTKTIEAFAQTFPFTPISLFVEAMGTVADMVLDGRCSVGVLGTLPIVPPDLDSERLFGVEMVTVVAPGTLLASIPEPVPITALQQQIQLVLSNRSDLTDGKDFGVLSSNTWRLADLHAKHAFLRAGLGWGHMPRALVADDIAAGRLVSLKIEGPGAGILPMHAIYRTDALPGPAGRWLIAEFHKVDSSFATMPRTEAETDAAPSA